MSIQVSKAENGIERNQLISNAEPNVLKRAQWEAFEFDLEAPGLVRVINGSHENPKDHSYRVNVESGKPVACECPAFEYGDKPCKHSVAVAIREPVMKAANETLVADGGQILETDSLELKDRDSDGRERALKANSLACDLTDIEGAGEDFDAFCAVVKVIQDSILREWTIQERQTERIMAHPRTSEEVVQ